MQKFYTKIGKKYVEVGYEFTGFPSNGTWLVKDGKQNCIIPVEGIPEMPSPSLVSYLQFREELQETISKALHENALSANDLSKIACDFFAIKAGGLICGNEIIEN